MTPRARLSLPLLLAVLAAALGAYILLVERQRASTDEARAARALLLPDLDRADVTELAIDRVATPRAATPRVATPRAGTPRVVGAPETVHLVRAREDSGAGAWRMLPGDMAASPSAVADLLDILDGLEVDRETDAAPAITGLDAPAARLTIATAARRRIVLELGRADASGRGVFVRLAGTSRTAVVSRRLADLVERDAAAFRERRLFLFLFAAGRVDAATGLTFASTGIRQRTLRRRDGVWLNNDGFFAATPAIREALRLLGALEASDFPPAPSAPATPDHALTLTLTVAGASAASADIAAAPAAPELRTSLDLWTNACPGQDQIQRTMARLTSEDAAARRVDWVCLDETVVSTLWHALDRADQRDLHLIAADPVALDGVVLSQGDRRLHLRRDRAAGWRITEPTVGYAADATVIDDWLRGLATTTLAAPARTQSAATPRGVSRRLLLEGAQQERIDVITQSAGVQGPRTGTVRVDRAGEAGPATAPGALFAALDPDPLRFRARAMLSLVTFDILGVETVDAGRRSAARRGPQDVWQLEDDATHALDVVALDRLLSAAAALQARRFLSATAPFNAARTIELTLREGTDPSGREHPDAQRRPRIEIDASCRARLGGIDTPDHPGASLFEVDAQTCGALRGNIARAR